MRKYHTVSISPWSNPYASALTPSKPYSQSIESSGYKRVIPVFTHPGVQLLSEGEDDGGAGKCTKAIVYIDLCN
jgi:hypothetical protein